MACRRGRGRRGVDGHLVEDGGGGDVDAFGDLGAEVADELDAEQPAGAAVAGEAHGDRVAAGVVGLVVVGLGGDGDRVEAGGGGFVVAKAGAGGDEVEDLDDLGAEGAGELAEPPSAFSPATRPCLWAVVPSGR